MREFLHLVLCFRIKSRQTNWDNDDDDADDADDDGDDDKSSRLY